MKITPEPSDIAFTVKYDWDSEKYFAEVYFAKGEAPDGALHGEIVKAVEQCLENLMTTGGTGVVKDPMEHDPPTDKTGTE
jgi:hypothetical protein